MSMEVLGKEDPAATRPEAGNGAFFFVPRADVVEEDERFVLRADLPGVEPGDIDLRLEQGQLTIRGRVARRQPEGTSFLLREYDIADFCRTFNVVEGIDGAAISAEIQDGVLTVRLPKSAAARPRRIAVERK